MTHFDDADDRLKKVMDNIEAVGRRTRPIVLPPDFGLQGAPPPERNAAPGHAEYTPAEIQARRERDEKLQKEGESDADYALRMERLMLSKMSVDDVKQYYEEKQRHEIAKRKAAEGRCTIAAVAPESGKLIVEFKPFVTSSGNLSPNGEGVIQIDPHCIYASWPEYTDKQLERLQAEDKMPEGPRVFQGDSPVGLKGKLFWTSPNGIAIEWCVLIEVA